jgi:hypothetical protein
MSDTGLIVPGMTEPPRRYDATITVDRDGGHLPNPAEFAVTAGQAASARAASIASAHTASQIVSTVTVLAADQPAAVPPDLPFSVSVDQITFWITDIIRKSC